MPKLTTQAIVIKSTLYKDADKIYTLFSKEKGKITALAKGVRKINSKRGGNLDSLNHIEVFINTNNDFNYITEVSTINSFKNIKKDYELSKHTFYIRELINNSILEDENVTEVFNSTIDTLNKLENIKTNTILTINKFEIKLMQLLGYQPPKKVLDQWLAYLDSKKYTEANIYIKNYITHIIEKSPKSLEIF